MKIKIKKTKEEILAARINKIFDAGKIKIEKGSKIILNPFIRNSVDNAIVSRSDAIISKENIEIDSPKHVTAVNIISSTMGKVSRALGRMDSAENQTIVLPIVNKKKSISCFNMLNDTIIGSLLRTSTLKPIYKKLKSEWEELNKDDKSDFVNVLYIPNILVFLDENTGKPLRQPYQINLLLISLPSTKYMLNANGNGNITDKNEIMTKIIYNIIDTIIVCGIKHVITSPYNCELFADLPYDSGNLWQVACSTERVNDNIKSIYFTINNDDLYIIFSGIMSNPDSNVNTRLLF